MKITLDIPDTTICAFFDFIHIADAGGYVMQGHSIQTDDLYDGAAIVIGEKNVEKV